QRTEIMATEDLSDAIRGLMDDSVSTLLDQHMPKQAAPSDWDLQGLADAVARDFNVRVDPKAWLEREPELEEQILRDRVVRAVTDAYDAKVARTGAPIMRHVEKDVMLRMLDQHWREHLGAMDYLRQGIHLRGYAQKDYRFEYKREAFELFANMLDRVKFETVSFLSKIEIRTAEEVEREEDERRERLMRALQAQHAEAQSVFTAAEAASPELPAGSSQVAYAQVPGVALPGTSAGGAGSRTLPHP